jgi:predicted deacylase
MTKDPESFEIGGTNIKPGESAVVKINVGRLPSATRIHVNIFVFRSLNPGPTGLILGGVHGDEINGVEIVRRSLESGLFNSLLSGTIIVIPLLNVYGFINFSREVPDGKDVNRSFPGNMKGSLASRVARVLTRTVMPHVHFAVDFHTGGASRYNFPQIRCTRQDPYSLELAQAFRPPFIIKKPLIKKSLRMVARDMGIPTLVYEGGEATRLDGFSILKGGQGLKNLLSSFKMIKHANLKNADPPPIIVEKTSWLRASEAGIFTWTKKSGVLVRKGEPLGVINDPFGTKKVIVLSKRSGYIVGHNNACVVNQGDALFNIGYEYSLMDE